MTGSREGRRPACERGGSACWTKAVLRMRTYASKTQFASIFRVMGQLATILMTVTFLWRQWGGAQISCAAQASWLGPGAKPLREGENHGFVHRFRMAHCDRTTRGKPHG